MTQQEFVSWIEFHRLFPFDDRHRYHRPAALISASSSHLEQDAFGAGVNARLDWLSPQPASEGVEGTYTQADLNTFAAFGVKPPGRG